MLLVGAVAFSALPRFVDRSAYDARGFHDGTLSILRYAQKTAVAQRREVCVTFSAAGVSPASVTLTVASAFSSVSTGVCDTNLAGPNGASPYQVVSAAGIGFVAGPANFSFMPSGSAIPGQSFTITYLTAQPVVVEGGTGYVH